MKNATPFILHGETKTNEFSAHINIWLKDFYNNWFSNGHAFHYQNSITNKKLVIENNQWEIFGNSSKFWIAFRKDGKSKQNTISAFFDLESLNSFKSTKFTDAIYQDFIKSNLDSLFELANLSNYEINVIKSVDTSFGSGALTGTIGDNQATLNIAFGGDFVKAICENSHVSIKPTEFSKNLVLRENSLDFLTTKIEVLAGNVELTLSDFNKMEIGDIVLLNSKVGGLFSARFSNNNEIPVQLGKLVEKKAIQFVEREYEKSR